MNLHLAFKSVPNLKLNNLTLNHLTLNHLKLNHLTLHLNPVLLLLPRLPNLPTRMFVHVALKLIVILYFPLNLNLDPVLLPFPA